MIKTTMRSYCEKCSKPVQLMSEDMLTGHAVKTIAYYCGECHVHIRTIKVEK